MVVPGDGEARHEEALQEYANAAIRRVEANLRACFEASANPLVEERGKAHLVEELDDFNNSEEYEGEGEIEEERAVRLEVKELER